MLRQSFRILITNDDGIHAPGLEVLEKIANEISDDVWVVAPETEQSGASHSLTLHLPLRQRQLGDKRFAVFGTPTDCVMMAVKHILPAVSDDDRPFDLVLSGVNRGSNIADDVTYSGTIAGAMEGTVLGIPSVALSQTHGFDPADKTVKWETALHHAPAILDRLLNVGWAKNVLININFPDILADHVEAIEVTSQGRRDQSLIKVDHRVDARGSDYFWLGFDRIPSNPEDGTDLRAIYSGRISVTPLHLNLTEHSSIVRLEELLGDLSP
jgi:5'-nucleotidase